MSPDETKEDVRARDQLVRQLPDASEIVRGSLLHRKIFHRRVVSAGLKGIHFRRSIKLQSFRSLAALADS